MAWVAEVNGLHAEAVEGDAGTWGWGTARVIGISLYSHGSNTWTYVMIGILGLACDGSAHTINILKSSKLQHLARTSYLQMNMKQSKNGAPLH